MRKGVIRPIVICVFQKGDSILVAEGMDPGSGKYYYRPIGGGIEYGERSSDALIREVKEELAAEIVNLQLLGTIENIFTFNGDLGHEIVQVYDADFVDDTFYSHSTFIGKEDDGSKFTVMWKSLREFQAGESRLVPDGLLDLLQK
ncbi:NUDIX hydrolase [Heyndrickxia sp. NPDC080065]|uniref:NUDIX hydrolase n=1 Tax=Heyndrickxia sp. NPDC080065 TaxID=3390568 RepID=UPI003D003DF6